LFFQELLEEPCAAMGCGASGRYIAGADPTVVAGGAPNVVTGIDPSVVTGGASEVVGSAVKVTASAAGLLSGTISGLPIIGKLFDAINQAYEKYQAVQDVVTWLRHLSQQAQYLDRAVPKLPSGSEEVRMLEKQIKEVTETIESKFLLASFAFKPQDVVDSLRDVHFRLCGVIQSIHLSIVLDATQHQASYTSAPTQQVADLIELLSRPTLQLEHKVPVLVSEKFDLDMLRASSEKELLGLTFSKLEMKRLWGELRGRSPEVEALIQTLLSLGIDTRLFEENDFKVVDAVLLPTGCEVYETILPTLGDRRRFEKWRGSAVMGHCPTCMVIVDDLAGHLQANHVCRLCSASTKGGCPVVGTVGGLCVLHCCSAAACTHDRALDKSGATSDRERCSLSFHGWCNTHHCNAEVCRISIATFAKYCVHHKCQGCVELAEDSTSYCRSCRCSVAGCGKSKYRADVCEQHVCQKCHGAPAQDSTSYCRSCRCSVEGCGKATNGKSEFCNNHMCGFCHCCVKDGRGYCSDCVCTVAGCVGRKYIGASKVSSIDQHAKLFCEKHACQYCNLFIEDGPGFCCACRCSVPGCAEGRASIFPPRGYGPIGIDVTLCYKHGCPGVYIPDYELTTPNSMHKPLACRKLDGHPYCRNCTCKRGGCKEQIYLWEFGHGNPRNILSEYCKYHWCPHQGCSRCKRTTDTPCCFR